MRRARIIIRVADAGCSDCSVLISRLCELLIKAFSYRMSPPDESAQHWEELTVLGEQIRLTLSYLLSKSSALLEVRDCVVLTFCSLIDPPSASRITHSHLLVQHVCFKRLLTHLTSQKLETLSNWQWFVLHQISELLASVFHSV